MSTSIPPLPSLGVRPLLTPVTSHRLTSRSDYGQDLPPNAGAVITPRLIDTIVERLPSQQKKRGDQKLEKARELTPEFGDLVSRSDHKIIEKRITL